MARLEPVFLLPSEVDTISQLSPVTRWRREKAGLFPRRLKISARKIAYRKSEIEDWAARPGRVGHAQRGCATMTVRRHRPVFPNDIHEESATAAECVGAFFWRTGAPMYAEVIPFPASRRLAFIARQARYAASIGPDAAERYLER